RRASSRSSGRCREPLCTLPSVFSCCVAGKSTTSTEYTMPDRLSSPGNLVPSIFAHRLHVLIVSAVLSPADVDPRRALGSSVEHHHVVGPAHENQEPTAEPLRQPTPRIDLARPDHERVVALDPGPHLHLEPAVQRAVSLKHVVDLVAHGQLVDR